MRYYMGIDPGLDGGIVVIDDDYKVYLAQPMPTVKTGVGGKRALDCLTFLSIIGNGGSLFAVLEEPGVRPREGAVGALTMGRNHGKLEMGLLSRGVSHVVVRPQEWQKLVCPGSGDPKARSVDAVRRVLPGLDLLPGKKQKPHDGIADAACMALYGRMKWGRG
jgi:crossover junction endodeoxyribonuclease RuvC